MVGDGTGDDGDEVGTTAGRGRDRWCGRRAGSGAGGSLPPGRYGRRRGVDLVVALTGGSVPRDATSGEGLGQFLDEPPRSHRTRR